LRSCYSSVLVTILKPRSRVVGWKKLRRQLGREKPTAQLERAVSRRWQSGEIWGGPQEHARVPVHKEINTT